MLGEKSLLRYMPDCLRSRAGANVFIFIDFWNRENARTKSSFVAIYMHSQRGGSREQLSTDFQVLSEPVRLRFKEDSDEGQNIDL
jgi:hypothetical protein